MGAAALEVWASAANATKSLDRKTVAEAIRGKTVDGTILGNVTFEANGQGAQAHAHDLQGPRRQDLEASRSWK